MYNVNCIIFNDDVIILDPSKLGRLHAPVQRQIKNNLKTSTFSTST